MGSKTKAAKERDQYMDLVLDGLQPKEVASALGWTPDEAKAYFRRAFYPPEPYVPHGRRKARSGMKMTQLELKIVSKHHEAGVPVAHTAKMLQRKPDEICPDYHGRVTFNQMKCLAPVSDQILAHHYLYHVSKTQIVTNQAYDSAKAEEIEFGAAGPMLRALSEAHGRATDYPAHIRSLAYYMLYKFMEVTGEWNDNVLPYSWGLEQKK